MAQHSERQPKNKPKRHSSPYQSTRHFPPLVEESSRHVHRGSSLLESSHSDRSSKTRSISSASSSLSSSSSRASSGYSTLSSRGSLMSEKSNRSNQNLDAIVEESDDCKNGKNHRPRLLSGPLGGSRGDPHSPPSSRVLSGAHYLKWYIPPQIAGSRALSRSAKSAITRNRVNELSPLHSPEKQVWLNKLVDPKGTSLPLPAPHKPLLPDHSKTAAKRADNIHEAFLKYQIISNPSHKHSYSLPKQWQHPPSSYSEIKSCEPPTLKSLLLQHDKQAYNSSGVGSKLDPLSSSFFTNSQLPVQSWFIVNPEWRKEPGKR